MSCKKRTYPIGVLLFLFLLFPFIGLAQTETANDSTDQTISKKHLEIGLNVTTVISSFLANNSSDLTNFDFGQASYPFSFKIVNGAKVTRFAMGLNVNRSNIFQLGFDEAIQRSFVTAKLGKEWRKPMGKRWLFFYGFDILGFYERLSSSVTTSIDRVFIIQNGVGAGAGPVYGLQFHLNKRMSLACEGSLYAIISYNSQRERFDINSIFDQAENSVNFSASTEVPKWLYFIIKF